MDNDKVMIGIGKTAKIYKGFFTEIIVQRVIADWTEGSIVPLEQIRECFDLMDGVWIDVYEKGEFEYRAKLMQ